MTAGKIVGAAGVALAVPVAALALILGSTASDGAATPPAGAMGAAGLNTSLMPAAGRAFAPWYVKSAAALGDKCPGISAPLLAAQGQQESGFNPSIKGPRTQYGQAQGIAQFLSTTYPTWQEEDEDQDGQDSPMDPEDAIMAQGRMMCSLYQRAQKSGYGGDPVALALAGYNAGWGNVERYAGVPPFRETTHYVAVITETARKWAQVLGGGASLTGTVRRAYTQLGTPYSYGGGTPSGPGYGSCSDGHGYRNGSCVAAHTKGWDCSSLTQYAYWPTVQLPRTAADQYKATQGRTIGRSQLKPGDLVFWSHGGASGIYHVAIYYGNGKILHAPRTGKSVGFAELSNGMPAGDYYGATRPG